MRLRLFNVKYSPNLGDGLLSECLEKALIEHGADAAATYSVDLAGRVAYAPGPASRTRLLAGLARLPPFIRSAVLRPMLAMQKRRRWAPHYAKHMNDCDGIVIGGGNLFTDMDLNFPTKICEVLRQAATLKLPVAIYGVGVGSHWSKAGQRMMIEALEKADLFHVSVRDAASKANLQSLFGGALRIPVNVVRDPGLLISRYVPSTADERVAPVGVCLTSAIAVRYHSDVELHDETLLRWYCSLIEKLQARKFEVRLFTNGSPEDVAFAAGVVDLLGERQGVDWVQPTTPTELASVVASCAAIVGFRMHALIAGASYGRALAALEWDPKLNAFMESLGLGDQVYRVPEADPDSIIRRLEDLCGPSVERLPNKAVEEALRDVQNVLSAYSARGSHPA